MRDFARISLLCAALLAMAGCASRPMISASEAQALTKVTEPLDATMVRYEQPRIKRWLWAGTRPKRWDMAVYRRKDDPDTLHALRVVAVDGETVDFKDGKLVVNGAPLDLPEALQGVEYAPGPKGAVSYPLTLSKTEYFLLADHPGMGADSRQFGPVDRWDIIGRILSVSSAAP